MRLRRLLILDQNYPSESNLYADGFVHARVKAYAREVEVVVASLPNSGPDWEYEGIQVRAFGSAEPLLRFIERFEPDAIGVHFAQEPLISQLLLATRIPFVVWVHGYEAMGFYRNLFAARSARQTASFAYTSSRRLLQFRRLLLHCRRTGRGEFVLPSNWLLRTVQIDTLARIPRAHVIPNPIDDGVFCYREKTPELRTRVLLLRSFDTKKYATDVAVDAIVHLSRSRAFERFVFHLYGRGQLFGQAASRLEPYANVELHERYFLQRDLPALYAEHGVMLCPTRQDTHGVTMCEAMCSGLVPISTRTSAIPEFVTDRVAGLLTSSSREIADRLLELERDPALFARLSVGAATEVRRKCGLSAVMAREFEVFERAVQQAAMRRQTSAARDASGQGAP